MGGDGQVFAFLSGEIGLDDGTDEKFSFFSGGGEWDGRRNPSAGDSNRLDHSLLPRGFKPHQRAFHTFRSSLRRGESMEDADRVVWNWLLGLFCGFVDQLPDLDEIRPLFLCLGDSRLAFGFQRAGFVRSPEVD